MRQGTVATLRVHSSPRAGGCRVAAATASEPSNEGAWGAHTAGRATAAARRDDRTRARDALPSRGGPPARESAHVYTGPDPPRTISCHTGQQPRAPRRCCAFQSRGAPRIGAEPHSQGGGGSDGARNFRYITVHATAARLLHARAAEWAETNGVVSHAQFGFRRCCSAKETR